MSNDQQSAPGPWLDPSVLEELRESLVDDQLLTEVIQTFLEETPAHLTSLVAATAAGDAAAAAAVAHHVKGSALTLGAVRLARTCAAIEASPSGQLAEKSVAEFDEVARRLGEFTALLSRHPGTPP